MDRFENWAGMNWIRKEKRLAIYLRDGMRCVYCGTGVGKCQLTLDHLDLEGTNDATNLVTACKGCNAARLDKNWKRFADDPYTVANINRLLTKRLDMDKAKAILERRNWNWTAALKSLAIPQ
jgi:5-methylcytosine-specific restriction endonuclease McrA